MRVDLDEGAAKVAVSKGNVRFEGPAGEAKVDKDHTATFDLSDGGQFTLAKGIESQKYDKWNQQESSFQSQYGGGSGAVGRSRLAYGMSDLNYYGGWYSVPGFGTMWQPYSPELAGTPSWMDPGCGTPGQATHLYPATRGDGCRTGMAVGRSCRDGDGAGYRRLLQLEHGSGCV